MKKIYFLSFLILGFIMQSQAQTKLIAHKSHSGSLSHFKTALEGNLFDMAASDFGDPGWTEEKHRLDSLVKIDDVTVHMYVTHFCKWGYSDQDTLKVCDTYNRRMTSTPYSEAEYEEDVIALLEESTGFDFPISESKIIGYKKKPKFEEIDGVPSNYDNNQQEDNETIQAEEEKPTIKEKTKKEIRKEKRTLKKANKKAKKQEEVKEKSETKTCTKPKVVMPVFIEEQIIEKEELVVSEKKGQTWYAIIGLTLFSLLLGGFTQFLKTR